MGLAFLLPTAPPPIHPGPPLFPQCIQRVATTRRPARGGCGSYGSGIPLHPRSAVVPCLLAPAATTPPRMAFLPPVEPTAAADTLLLLSAAANVANAHVLTPAAEAVAEFLRGQVGASALMSGTGECLTAAASMSVAGVGGGGSAAGVGCVDTSLTTLMTAPTVNEIAAAVAGGTVGVMGTLIALEVNRQKVGVVVGCFRERQGRCVAWRDRAMAVGLRTVRGVVSE